MGPYTWEELGRATLRRQFPHVRGRRSAAVADLVARTGPIQSQVARSPYVGVAARIPGVTHAAVEEAYISRNLLRGSNIRGTVHTSTAEQHELLDAVTRRSLAPAWTRSLGLVRHRPADVQEAIERFATGAWRTPAELRTHLEQWLLVHEGTEQAARARTNGVGRSTAHLHGALVRAPLTGTGWDRQTGPGYRRADELTGRDRTAVVSDPHSAMVELCRHHVRWYGPSSRRDIAWWSGDRLRDVDAALAVLGDELVGRTGPNGETCSTWPRGCGAVPTIPVRDCSPSSTPWRSRPCSAPGSPTCG